MYIAEAPILVLHFPFQTYQASRLLQALAKQEEVVQGAK